MTVVVAIERGAGAFPSNETNARRQNEHVDRFARIASSSQNEHVSISLGACG